MKTKNLLSALGITIMLTACSSDSPAPNPDPVITPAEEDTEHVASGANISLSDREKAVRNALNDFAFRLYATELSQHAETENLCLSPFGVYQILSMAVNGDNGITAEELRGVLSPAGSPFTTEDLNSFNATMTYGLIDTDSDASVAVANSVWVESELIPTAAFKKSVTEWYKADFASAVLGSQSCMDAINSWCADKTKGLINPYLDKPLDPSTSVFLVNALYFKGIWTDQFDVADTQTSSFGNIDHTNANVPMMAATFAQSCLLTDDATITSKQFGAGKFEMIFVLPEEGKTIIETASKLPDLLSSFDTGASTYDVTFSMPRFENTVKFDLNSTLKSMGINNMYSVGFNAMIEQLTPTVSEVLQKVTIDVDENGATAAAVSSMVMDGASGIELPYVKIDLNRPFLYLIRERNSQTVLFIGQVVKF